VKVTLDPALRGPQNWKAVTLGFMGFPIDEAIGAAVVALMATGHPSSDVDARCGRQALIWLAETTKRPPAPDYGQLQKSRAWPDDVKRTLATGFEPRAATVGDLRTTPPVATERARRETEQMIDDAARALGVSRVPASPTLAIRHLGAGTWRVYYHRLNPEGLPWCVSPDAGGFEIAVREVEIYASSRGVHRPKPTADDEDGRPSAWIEVTGVLEVIEDGRATIKADS
jgi:hypothetical protein